jgi:hypothetical protein
VLVDFWTYTCINWLRTLPYVRGWAQRYRQQLIVVGVHTPEFPFEQRVENVRRSVRQMDVPYPVVIDNDHSIWRAFNNEYWPALYFIDARGRVRDHHFGEGEYARSEHTIRRLLADADPTAPAGDLAAPAPASGFEAPPDTPSLRSPETYVGYERTERFASPGGAEIDRRQRYAVPPRLAVNEWALSGDWTIGRQATLLNTPNGRIAYRFHARDLHLVLAPPRQGTARFRVSIDGKPPGASHGLDVDDSGAGTVVEPRLYQLIRQSPPIVDRQFDIEFLDPAVEAYSFTFG